jgi:hypothetical protein
MGWFSSKGNDSGGGGRSSGQGGAGKTPKAPKNTGKAQPKGHSGKGKGLGKSGS